MLEKGYFYTLQENAKENINIIPKSYRFIKKGDKINVIVKNGKTKQQIIEGICVKIKKNKFNPALTIKYKLSGVIIEQRIPFGLDEVIRLEKK